MDKPDKKDDVIKEGGLTYEDYAKLPEDGPRYELADGQLELMSPGPTSEHQIISSNLEWVMNQSCRFDYIILHAPIDVIISQREVRQPDVVMIHRSRSAIVTRRGIEGPPDLVVEILSPSTALKDKKIKRERYARFGVPEYWIIDPAHRLLEQNLLSAETSEYRLHQIYGDEENVTSPLIECLSVPMNEVFRNLDLLNREGDE